MTSNTSDRNASKTPDDRHYFIVRNLIDAAQSGDEKQVKAIIRKCSNFQKQILDSRNDWGSTALHHAAEGGHLDVVKILVCARASATILNNQGETCLHRATFAKQTAVVSFLASKCPDAIDVPSDAGATALHYAAKYGYCPIAKYLIKHGASLDKENNIGETPLAVSDRYKHLDVFFLISKEQERRDDTGVSEINSLEKDVVEAYQKTIKYSLKPEHRFLLMIVGGHGCGKTNLKYALTGEFHLQKDHETPPTQGIDADPSVCRIKTKQYKDWISEPSPNANRNLAVQRVKLEYTDLVIRQMLNELKSKKCLVQKKKFAKSYTASHHDPPSLYPAPTKGVKFIDPVNSDTFNLPTEDDLQPNQVPNPTDLPPDSPKTVVKEQVTFSPYLRDCIRDEQILHRLHFRWANEVFQKTPYPEDTDYLSLNFWDFSGDPKFRTIVPFFLTGRSGYIVTYNADRMFQEYNGIKDSGGVTETEETLVYWLSLISTMFSTSSISMDALAPAKSDIAWTPSVIIVGTHSDKLVDPNAQKEVKLIVRDIVYKHRRKFSFYLCDPMYTFLLNTIEDELYAKEVNEGNVEMEPLHFLRRDIENLAFDIPVLRQPIPLQWSQFERIIYELREQRQEVNSLKYVMIYISNRAQICEPMEVIPMLSYFHDIGMILFYAKHPILRQYIILEPQFLVDLVANLFNPPKSFSNSSSKDAKTQLYLTGQLLYKFRRCAWLDVSLTEESEQYVMEIIEAMNIIAQPKTWKNNKKKSDVFYAPSFVERPPPLNFLSDLRESGRVAPLYFMIQHDQLLKNIYTYIVCSCIKEGMRDPELYSEVAYISFETFTLCIFLEKEAIGFSLIPEAIHSSATSEEEISHSPPNINSELEDKGFTDLNNLLYDIGCSLSIPLIVRDLNEKCRFVRNALESQLKQILKIWFPNLRYWLCFMKENLEGESVREFVKLGRGKRNLDNAPDSVLIWF